MLLQPTPPEHPPLELPSPAPALLLHNLLAIHADRTNTYPTIKTNHHQ